MLYVFFLTVFLLNFCFLYYKCIMKSLTPLKVWWRNKHLEIVKYISEFFPKKPQVQLVKEHFEKVRLKSNFL